MNTITILIFSLCGFIVITAVAAAAETAYTSINFIKLKTMSMGEHYRAKQAQKVIALYKNFNATLATILIIGNVVNISASAVVTFLLGKLIADQGIAAVMAVVITAPTIILLGEIIPKMFAKKYAISYSILIVDIIVILNFIFLPITYFIKKMNLQNGPTATESEIISLINIAEKEGILEREESILTANSLRFDSFDLSVVMTNIDDMISINADATFKQIIKMFKKYGYTRIPIKNEQNNYKKIINYKLVLSNMDNKRTQLIKNYSYNIITLNQSMKLNKALQELQREKQHFALVKHNRKIIGFVTLEDIIEILVGKIYDESDKTGSVREIGNNKFLALGSVNIKTLFKVHLKNDKLIEGITTSISLTNWFKEEFNIKKLKKGMSQTWENYKFQINKVNKNKIIFIIEELSDKK